MIALGLLVGWLAAALIVLALDGLLPEFLAWAMPGSLLVLGVVALIRWHRRPSLYCRPSVAPLPARYRAADDLGRPLVEVVARPSWTPRSARGRGRRGAALLPVVGREAAR